MFERLQKKEEKSESLLGGGGGGGVQLSLSQSLRIDTLAINYKGVKRRGMDCLGGGHFSLSLFRGKENCQIILNLEMYAASSSSCLVSS